jgi:hypothetical protein
VLRNTDASPQDHGPLRSGKKLFVSTMSTSARKIVVSMTVLVERRPPREARLVA